MSSSSAEGMLLFVDVWFEKLVEMDIRSRWYGYCGECSEY